MEILTFSKISDLFIFLILLNHADPADNYPYFLAYSLLHEKIIKKFTKDSQVQGVWHL
jgi:hypothetical protein